ncbi:tetratricopeptide repeat protein [Lacibacter sp. H407]|uniref:tetratricopeptide repeat protein n=1 Tax=Lacibacter sp. H407 TaxID=3133423 RepID=UPI0030C1291C
MSCFKTQLLRICIVSSFALLCLCSLNAQSKSFNVDEVAKLLNDPSKKGGFSAESLGLKIFKSGNADSVLSALEEKMETHAAWSYFYMIKSTVVYLEGLKADSNNHEPKLNPLVKPKAMELFAKAMQEAYLTGDDRFIAQTSIVYGLRCYAMKELELAVTYALNGLELNEKLNIENSPPNHMVVGEILYKIREYKESVKHSLKAYTIWEQRNATNEKKRMMWSCNTAALGYHRLQQYDSAFIWYRKAMELADELKLEVWQGIISGNMGQVYYQQKKYDSALVLLLTDYRISTKEELFDNAANSLQWAARTQVQLGNKSTALKQLREAMALLKNNPDVHYLRNALYTATEVFKALGEYDSAFYYNAKHAALNDSLERVIALSGIAVSKARANDEKNRYSIQSLQKEKEKQVLLRNILIAAIVLLGIVGFLAITRQRLKAKLQVERMEQDKQRIQLEISSAREQLTMFTENIVEKTSLIEKLEEQVKDKSLSTEKQLLITELSQQTILTEDDWLKFKSLFEKIYPSFFQKLKENSADITVAEQRMAALTRMQLTSKQMAAMLGISVDSVHKTRQRLRQRLQLSSDINLDEYIAGI